MELISPRPAAGWKQHAILDPCMHAWQLNCPACMYGCRAQRGKLPPPPLLSPRFREIQQGNLEWSAFSFLSFAHIYIIDRISSEDIYDLWYYIYPVKYISVKK